MARRSSPKKALDPANEARAADCEGRKAATLAGVREGASLKTAAEAAGASARSALRWKQLDPAFARALVDAEAEGGEVRAAARRAAVEALEREAIKRALAGDAKLIVYLLASYEPETFSVYGQAGRAAPRPFGFSPEAVGVAMRRAQHDVELCTVVEPPMAEGDEREPHH